MSLTERVAKLYETRRLGRWVTQLFFQRSAMSLTDAKKTLGFPVDSEPSDSEVNRAYRQHYIDNRRLHPDMGGDPQLAVALNVAKDTLLGIMAPDRGSFSSPQKGREPSGGWQEKDRYKPNEEPVPPPPGGPFQSAVRSNVDWKVLSSQTVKQDYVVEEGKVAPDGRPFGYWNIVESWVLIGVTSTEYVFLDLVKHTRSRLLWSQKSKTTVSTWTTRRTAISFKSDDILKIGPKVIKDFRGNFPGRPKFMVLESKLSEAMVEKSRPSLSFKDAVIGSGLVSSETGRKAQVELEPVFNRELWKAMDLNERRMKFYKAYDWFVYVNGQKTKLDENEIDRMDRNYIFLSVFSYDYKKKVNLTRLRGGMAKMNAKESIQKLADSLNPGSLKNQLEEISRSF